MGSDHFITLGRRTWDFRRLDQPEIDWGSSFINMDQNRSSLFCVVGGARADFKNDFRALLLNQCGNESDSCRLIDCGKTECAVGRTPSLETFLGSDFCLQPRGDSYTRSGSCRVNRRVTRFFFFFFFFFIDRRHVRNGLSIKKVLEQYSREEVRKMREKVIELIPKFVYAKPREGFGLMRGKVGSNGCDRIWCCGGEVLLKNLPLKKKLGKFGFVRRAAKARLPPAGGTKLLGS
ncbi:unnamed protein product [Camellia sinensis]